MAINAQGTTIQVDNTTPGTADQAIGGVVSFSGLDGEAAEIDITNLGSVAKETALGLKDFGSFSMEMQVDYADVGQNTLRSAGSNLKAFKITLPSGDVLDFQGVVKNADAINGGVDAVVTGSVAIKISGAVAVS